ncbi:MAG TPA: DUF2721 domain-containing protein [Candidatus Limnocylindria bacterium]|nr:DUF2721 domain-containing protein [Candidatus Limnocylindria bacterium]
MRLEQILPVLQLAVSPVILISGVGLLLLSMTNRFGRVVDRLRAQAELRRRSTPSEQGRISMQMDILGVRCRLVRSAIWFAASSLLLAAVMVIALFVVALMRWEAAGLLVGLFVACLLSLIVSLVYFLRDINLSLRALDLEVRSGTSPTGDSLPPRTG